MGIFLLLCLLAASCDSTGQPASTPAPPTAKPATSPAALDESPFTGHRAPDFTLADLDGHSVALHDYRGHPVWINLWATWCVPCKSEMPAMQQLYNRYKAEGLVILGVNAQEDRSTAAAYVRQGAYDWPILLDPDSVVRSKYLFQGVPSHVFIDKAGVIKGISVGELDAAGMASYLARIVGPAPGG